MILNTGTSCPLCTHSLWWGPRSTTHTGLPDGPDSATTNVRVPGQRKPPKLSSRYLHFVYGNRLTGTSPRHGLPVCDHRDSDVGALDRGDGGRSVHRFTYRAVMTGWRDGGMTSQLPSARRASAVAGRHDTPPPGCPRGGIPQDESVPSPGLHGGAVRRIAYQSVTAAWRDGGISLWFPTGW